MSVISVHAAVCRLQIKLWRRQKFQRMAIVDRAPAKAADPARHYSPAATNRQD